jgi:hypothetical protein
VPDAPVLPVPACAGEEPDVSPGVHDWGVGVPGTTITTGIAGVGVAVSGATCTNGVAGGSVAGG